MFVVGLTPGGLPIGAFEGDGFIEHRPDGDERF